jgi:energy-coupling factor transport system substrate-specific component
VTWQAAAYGILAVTLAIGFAWYELTRPDARIVALVGTLAAFAALGRIAFAAIPNVKPTTDIVLISGYALGGAPGFVVGAVAALTSNFFFGQGPWTPWQMVGWGAVGVIGAGLATVTGHRIGRWPLAIVCFVAGFAFTALQDVGDWVTYSDHSLAQLGVYVGKGLGFDLIHATGCLVFALAFGPALNRSLQRFRVRLQVVWAAAALLVVATLALPAAAPPRALAAADAPNAAARTAAYLTNAQNPDGGFGPSPGSGSAGLYAGWAALGLAAAGEDPQGLRRPGGRTLAAYLAATAGSERDPGSLERSILALRAAGLPAQTAAGHSLVALLQHHIRADGSVSGLTNQTAFAVLALRAAGVTPRPRTLAWLARQQDADGGFNFATAPGVSDVDDTGAVLEALAGTGRAARIARAVHYLRGQQNRDGGFPAQPGADSNAQSTAFAVQGLIAAAVQPARLHHLGGPSPIGYLTALIAPDGHVRYAAHMTQTPVWVTAQALLALAGKPLPLTPLPAPTTTAAPATPRTPAAAPTRRHHPRARPTSTGRRPSHATLRGGPLRAGPARVTRSIDLDALAADAGVLVAVLLAPVNV